MILRCLPMQVIAVLMVLVISASCRTMAQVPKAENSEINVIYGMHGGLALLMDVYHPAEPNGYGVLVIPGSGFHQLMSYDASPLNKNQRYLSSILGTDNLLDGGYTLFVINHRSSPVFRYPAAVEDAQRAVQFIRHHADRYNIDGERLGAIGHSSGAHLVSMLGTVDDAQNPSSRNPIDRESSRVQAVAALAGVFDLTKIAAGSFGDIGAITSFVGTHLPAWRDEKEPREHEFALYDQASPINHVTEDDAAFLLVHGTDEQVIHVDQSSDFSKQLLDHDVPTKLVIVEGADHALQINGKVVSDEYYHLVLELFDREIRGE